MKIVGYTYYKGKVEMAMKSDSSLLNQRKPFFLPDWSEQIKAMPCVVVRINHLGRHIAEKFASRYYDAIALGINFRAEDLLEQGKQSEGIAFDDSLCVGNWLETGTPLGKDQQTVMPIESAIARISARMTLRTGDLIYIDTQKESCDLVPEQIISEKIANEEVLYCKIK